MHETTEKKEIFVYVLFVVYIDLKKKVWSCCGEICKLSMRRKKTR